MESNYQTENYNIGIIYSSVRKKSPTGQLTIKLGCFIAVYFYNQHTPPNRYSIKNCLYEGALQKIIPGINVIKLFLQSAVIRYRVFIFKHIPQPRTNVI
jgi:hypothetical protein